MSTCRAIRGGKSLGAGRPCSKAAPATPLKRRNWQSLSLDDRREAPRPATRPLPGQVRAGKMQLTAIAPERQSGTHRFEARAYGADLTAKGEPLTQKPSAHARTYVTAAAPRPSRLVDGLVG